MVKDTDKILRRKAVAVRDRGPDTNTAHKQPIITAKGRGYAAERILDIAFAEGVKVRRDGDLTDMLEAFDENSPVPLEALHAVGLILERVYLENRSKMDKTATMGDNQAAGEDQEGAQDPIGAAPGGKVSALFKNRYNAK